MKSSSGVLCVALIAMLWAGVASAQYNERAAAEDKEKLMSELQRLTEYTNTRYDNMMYQKKVRAAVEQRHKRLGESLSDLSMEDRLEAEFEAEMATIHKSTDDLVKEETAHADAGRHHSRRALGLTPLLRG
mmetsp:Transcript_21431/g.53192  ORF Transcript_21431/g.53192 Transcript_21431/m.53192 type:complete len:131 (-) Transcript_21431:112-504(-)